MEAIAGVDDLALALLATLAAFGISFTAAGGIDEVGPWVVDQFERFVDSAGESFSLVADRIRVGVDKAGNLIGNSYALSYNARFASWMESQYSLQDNSQVLVSDSVRYLPITAYNTNAVYNAGYLDHKTLFSSDNAIFNWYYASNYSGVVVVNFGFDGSSELRGCIIASLVQCQYYLVNHVTYLDSRPSFSFPVSQGSVSNQDLYGYFYYTDIYDETVLDYFDSSCVGYYADTYEDAYRLVFDLLHPTPIFINSGSIDIPQVGDYSDDDGILIDGLGSWGDTLQDIWDKVSGLTVPDVSWPTVSWGAELADQLVDSLVSAGELTTENSPGFYNGLPLIGGIPDIQFGNLWHYVTDWVSSMSGGLALIGGIMFSLPFVAAFYSLVVILLVLSLWRLLRSA